MRNLLVLGLTLLALAVIAPVASANWCSPQYVTCGNDDDDGGSGGGDPSGSSDIPRNGDKHYGSLYDQCLASYPSGSYCHECAFDPRRNNAPMCSSVRHQAKCGCTINYQNYIAVSCRTNGYCEFMWQ